MQSEYDCISLALVGATTDLLGIPITTIYSWSGGLTNVLLRITCLIVFTANSNSFSLFKNQSVD